MAATFPNILNAMTARIFTRTRCSQCTRLYRRRQAFSSTRRTGSTRNNAITAATATKSAPSTASFSTSASKRASSIVQPSLWSSMIPKPFRSSSSSPSSNSIGSRYGQQTDQFRNGSRFARLVRFWENPSTPFMLLGLLLGSQSVRLIVLKMERDKIRERTEARLRTLREVLEAVKAGEDVDVRARLGTGNEEDEREWEEVIHNLATDEIVLKSRRAAWRERKEAQRTDIDRETKKADRVDEAQAMRDETQHSRNENKNALAKDKLNDSKGKKLRAEFY